VTQRYTHLSNESLMAAAACVGSLVPAFTVSANQNINSHNQKTEVTE